MSKFKPLIRICGVTSVDRAIQIAELGVDAIGIISVKESQDIYLNKIKIIFSKN